MMRKSILTGECQSIFFESLIGCLLISDLIDQKFVRNIGNYRIRLHKNVLKSIYTVYIVKF